MSQFRLLNEKKFYPIFWTMFLGAFNDNFFKNALIILINYKAQHIMGVSPSQMVALSGGIFILPFFLFSATSGQIADKYEKTKIISIVKLAEILIMGLAFFGLVYEHFAFLMLVLFLMGTHSAFFGPVKYSILPQHLKGEEMLAGNALVEAGTFLAILLGTICGGVLINLESNANIIVGVGLLLVAGLGFYMSRKIPHAEPVDPGIKIEWNPVTPTYKVFQLAKKNKSVFLSIISISWFWFFGAIMLSLFPIYCREYLAAGASVVTLFLAIFSIGIGIGSLLCEKIAGKKVDLSLVVFGTIGMSLFTFDLFLVGQPMLASGVPGVFVGISKFFEYPGSVRIIFDLLMVAVFSGFYIVPLYTLLQVRSHSTIGSRIIAANNVLNALFMVVSAIMLMQLIKFKLSVPQVFLILAVSNLLFMSLIFSREPEFMASFQARLKAIFLKK